jgi:Planctomycete cytochrome C
MASPRRLFAAREEQNLKPILIAGALILPFVAACAVSSSSEPATPSYANNVEPVIAKRCLGCHSAEKHKAGLVLDKGAGYKDLTTRMSVQVTDMPLVKAGDPGGSYLWKKLTHTASKGKGMPRTLFGSKKLPADEMELIKDWIQTGAKP